MNAQKYKFSLLTSVIVILFFINLLFEFVPSLYPGSHIYWFYFFVHFILVAVFLIVTVFDNKIEINKRNKILYLFFLVWISYNMISFWWSKNPPKTAEYSFRFMCFFIDFLIASQIFKTNAKRKLFYYFIQFIIVLYLSIAVWEILTWHHLPTSRLAGSMIFTPTGPFYNENDFAEVLLFLQPFIIFAPKLFHNKNIWKIISVFEIFIINALFLIQGARIAMIFEALILTFSFFYFLRKREKILISLFLISSFFLALFTIKPLRELLKYEYETNIASLVTEDKSIYVGSIDIRKQMIKNAIQMSAESYFFGTGGATYEENMRIYSKKETAGIINCHNFLFELLATNGLFIFLFFLYFLFRIAIINISAIKKDRNDYYAWMNLFLILLFIPASSLSSSSYKFFYFWSVLGISMYPRNIKEKLISSFSEISE